MFHWLVVLLGLRKVTPLKREVRPASAEKLSAWRRQHAVEAQLDEAVRRESLRVQIDARDR